MFFPPSYKVISSANAVLTFALFAILLIAPSFIFWIFSIEAGEAAYFIARRASILFLGLSLMSYLSRNASSSEMRQSVIISMFVLWAAMACLGIVEFARGYAGIGVLLAVAAEAGFAFGYWTLWRSSRLSPNL